MVRGYPVTVPNGTARLSGYAAPGLGDQPKGCGGLWVVDAETKMMCSAWFTRSGFGPPVCASPLRFWHGRRFFAAGQRL